MAVKMSDATHERLYDVEIAANFASAAKLDSSSSSSYKKLQVYEF